MNYTQKYQSYLNAVDAALISLQSKLFNNDATVAHAALYSLNAGGKRVRAVLCLAVSEMLCGNAQAAANYAAGIEMLHGYSLIHDDLPCMDNDDLRRGKPSCHRAFDEATALLAGDALLTAAFEALAVAAGSPAQNAEAVALLAHSAGTYGMIYGQELDLRFEKTGATEKQLRELHRNKTGMLINAAVQLGAISAGNSFHQDRQVLEQYAYGVGLAFQIVDDVLDVTGNAAEFGKPLHSDEKSGKTTFVTLLGVENSLNLAQQITQSACDGLCATFGEKSDFLAQLAGALLERNH